MIKSLLGYNNIYPHLYYLYSTHKHLHTVQGTKIKRWGVGGGGCSTDSCPFLPDNTLSDRMTTECFIGYIRSRYLFLVTAIMQFFALVYANKFAMFVT